MVVHHMLSKISDNKTMLMDLASWQFIYLIIMTEIESIVTGNKKININVRDALLETGRDTKVDLGEWQELRKFLQKLE